MTLKIIKEIHSYSGRVVTKYIIHRKSYLTGWDLWYKREFSITPDFCKSYGTFEEAEKDIFSVFSKDLGGIISIDNGVYKLSKYCLPIA